MSAACLDCSAAAIRRPARVYDLRSTFASRALGAGVSVFELARVMGTSVQMIERHYERCWTAREPASPPASTPSRTTRNARAPRREHDRRALRRRARHRARAGDQRSRERRPGGGHPLEMLTPVEQDRWLAYVGSTWPRRDGAVKTLLPAADKLLAEMWAADS